MKEYGEGVDRMCRELIANGVKEPKYHTDDFILKITVPRVTEKSTRVTEKEKKLPEKLPENRIYLIDKIIEKSKSSGDKLTENRIAILKLMLEDPYISKSGIAIVLGLSYTAVGSNINVMRGKYLRRVGSDKGGFWEVISD